MAAGSTRLRTRRAGRGALQLEPLGLVFVFQDDRYAVVFGRGKLLVDEPRRRSTGSPR